ncbi:MAG: phosphoribosylamine--glycine ligase [Spirochaetia bacterium]|nr:phosphoribosylamine--glycine ligase [Spirochaetia bacterium]
MKVLVLGSGAREHAITLSFSKSKSITGLFTAPGNAGTDEIAENLSDIDPCSSKMVIDACRKHNIDFVFVGPEAPLSSGIVDDLQKAGIKAIGPHKAAAMLESSKAFSKNFMIRHNIPTAEAVEISSPEEFEKIINIREGKTVIKKSGLAAGKGVLESDDREKLLEFGLDILKDDKLLIEEYLSGWEVTIFTLTDGRDYIILPSCADFKKAYDNDEGPNTGGMGAICPVPSLTSQMLEEIKKTIIEPTFRGIDKEGLNYKGVLYFGLMITKQGPKLLEYNVRFGDPETQALLPLILSDFGELCSSILKGTIKSFPLKISNESAICVVIAAGGYPGEYKKGIPVDYIPHFSDKYVVVYHASTRFDDFNNVITWGGRCFSVVGLGADFITANKNAYVAAEEIYFKSSFYRHDIGRKFFERGHP